LEGSLHIPGSKSISNRLLIIRALSGIPFQINNLSLADDTCELDALLQSGNKHLNVGPAGTSFRFLTAYCAITPGEWIIEGTDRLHQRPIRPLVQALRQLGADIVSLNRNGKAPLRIRGKALKANGPVTIQSDQSSQFVSALLMIAPLLPGGLHVHLEGNLQSAPYIQLTLELMHLCGIEYLFTERDIYIKEKAYTPPAVVEVESDWSSAAVWFAMAALAKEVNLKLTSFTPKSFQGDAALLNLAAQFGVSTSFIETGLLLTKNYKPEVTGMFEHDFNDNPDLVPYLLMLAALKKVNVHFTNIAALALKESDRLASMQAELLKVGVQMAYSQQSLHTKQNKDFHLPNILNFNTYNDHRMAMALSIPAMCGHIVTIENPSVVSKSYPNFWEHMQALGFVVEEM